MTERISLGTTTVSQLIHPGALGCVRVGRALIIIPEDLRGGVPGA